MENQTQRTPGKFTKLLTSPTLYAMLAVLVFLVSAILTLPDYGLAWDESLGNAFFGERYLYYYRTFDNNYLDFDAVPQTLAKLPLDLSASTWRDQPNVFPPFADTVAAGTLHLFSYTLNWLNPIDGLHLSAILFAALLLVSLFFFLKKRVSAVPALIAVLALASFPRFWGDAHFNIKDVPTTVLFALSIFSYVLWYEKPHWLKAILFGVLFGLTTLTKINAVFVPIVVMLGLWGSRWRSISKGEFLPLLKQFLLHHLFMVIAAFHTILLGWPLVSRDFHAFIEYVTRFMGQGKRSGPAYFQWETIRLTFASMPEYFALFLLLGIGVAAFLMVRKKNPFYRLLLVWCLLPIVRIALPGMSNFDGIRHYLEFIPAAAALVGIGIWQTFQWLRTKTPRPVALSVPVLLTVLMVVNLADAFYAYRPYEFLYYNRISGGTSAAIKDYGKDQVSDYWAVSYRAGLEWINENAEANAGVFTPIGGEIVDITRRVLLRPDLKVISDEAQALSSAQPVYIMFINRPAFFKSLEKKLIAEEEPVYTIEKQGHVILFVFKR